MLRQAQRPVEWPTLGLLALTYALWLVAIGPAGATPLVGLCLVALAVTLHSSLQHEVLHGHPTPARWLNEALVFPTLTLCVPYLRFRDTHLAHHQDADLTDPYDDPESNYFDPAVWATLPAWTRVALRFNNLLLGRLLIGPLVSQIAFMASDARAISQGDRQVLAGWLWHLPSLALVLGLYASIGQLPFWALLLGTYAGLSILKIRTFLEHQAHETHRGRTVIIEDRGPLSWLFLNNNLHVVHHMHPQVPWYGLPGIYRAGKGRFLRINHGYVFGSYADVFANFLLHAKDPVPHPLMADATGADEDREFGAGPIPATMTPKPDPVPGRA